MSNSYPTGDNKGFEPFNLASEVSAEARLMLGMVPNYIVEAKRLDSLTAGSHLQSDINRITYQYEYENLASIAMRFVPKFGEKFDTYTGLHIKEMYLYIPLTFMSTVPGESEVPDISKAPEAVLAKIITTNQQNRKYFISGTGVTEYEDFEKLELVFVEKADGEGEVAVSNSGGTWSQDKQLSDILMLRNILSNAGIGNQSRNDGTAA